MKHEIEPRTCLDNIRSYIIEYGIDLLPHKLRRDVMDIIYTGSVLRGQRGRSRQGVAAMGGDDSLVGLEATLLERESALASRSDKKLA